MKHDIYPKCQECNVKYCIYDYCVLNERDNLYLYTRRNDVTPPSFVVKNCHDILSQARKLANPLRSTAQ